jgi:hypothetical protein
LNSLHLMEITLEEGFTSVRGTFEWLPEDKKLELATMHMNDKAETWMQGVVHKGMFWEEFVEEVIERFEQK